MHTTHLLTVSCSVWGVCPNPPPGCRPHWMHSLPDADPPPGCRPPPVDRTTDTCENITFPQTSFAGGNHPNKECEYKVGKNVMRLWKPRMYCCMIMINSLIFSFILRHIDFTIVSWIHNHPNRLSLLLVFVTYDVWGDRFVNCIEIDVCVCGALERERARSRSESSDEWRCLQPYTWVATTGT